MHRNRIYLRKKLANYSKPALGISDSSFQRLTMWYNLISAALWLSVCSILTLTTAYPATLVPGFEIGSNGKVTKISHSFDSLRDIRQSVYEAAVDDCRKDGILDHFASVFPDLTDKAAIRLRCMEAITEALLVQMKDYLKAKDLKNEWAKKLQANGVQRESYYMSLPIVDTLFLWKVQFADVFDKPLKILEVGSYRGGSAMWFSEHIMDHEDSHLYCLDAWVASEEEWAKNDYTDFVTNVLRSRNHHKVSAIPSDTSFGLAALLAAGHSGTFDFILVDGSHMMVDVLNDAIQAFQLLKVGGTIIFDDYTCNPFIDGPRRVKEGVDAFYEAHKSALYVLFHGNQQVNSFSKIAAQPEPILKPKSSSSKFQCLLPLVQTHFTHLKTLPIDILKNPTLEKLAKYTSAATKGVDDMEGVAGYKRFGVDPFRHYVPMTGLSNHLKKEQKEQGDLTSSNVFTVGEMGYDRVLDRFPRAVLEIVESENSISEWLTEAETTTLGLPMTDTSGGYLNLDVDRLVLMPRVGKDKYATPASAELSEESGGGGIDSKRPNWQQELTELRRRMRSEPSTSSANIPGVELQPAELTNFEFLSQLVVRGEDSSAMRRINGVKGEAKGAQKDSGINRHYDLIHLSASSDVTATEAMNYMMAALTLAKTGGLIIVRGALQYQRYDAHVDHEMRAWEGYDAAIWSAMDLVEEMTNLTTCHDFRVFKKMRRKFSLTNSRYDELSKEPCCEKFDLETPALKDTNELPKVPEYIPSESSPAALQALNEHYVNHDTGFLPVDKLGRRVGADVLLDVGDDHYF